MTSHREAAKVSYSAILYAVKKEKRIKIKIQKVSGSRMYAARASVKSGGIDIIGLNWDLDHKAQMNSLKKWSAIDRDTGKPKKYAGEVVTVIGCGDGASKIIIRQQDSWKVDKINKAFALYFHAVLGKRKMPRLVIGGADKQPLMTELEEDDFEGLDEGTPMLSASEEEQVENLVSNDAPDVAYVDDTLSAKISKPFSDEEIDDVEWKRVDDALAVKRERKEKERADGEDRAERIRSERLSPALRANVAADVAHVVAGQFKANHLLKAEQGAEQAAVVRLLATAVEEMTRTTTDPAKQELIAQDLILGVQLALSFPHNLQTARRLAKNAKPVGGNPWGGLKPAEQGWLKNIIKHHEVRDQHELVAFLFQMARDKAIDLKQQALHV